MPICRPNSPDRRYEHRVGSLWRCARAAEEWQRLLRRAAQIGAKIAPISRRRRSGVCTCSAADRDGNA